LLKAKLQAPAVNQNIISREKLQRKFRRVRECNLTLVIAPAGYGKTTTVLEWLGKCGLPWAWLSFAPILLVGDSEAAQKKILDYLTANLEADGRVYILGGTAVIGQSFEDRLRDVGIKQTVRLAGSDCYDTSVKIAEQLQVETGTPVVLVSGENYPDALSVSSQREVENEAGRLTGLAAEDLIRIGGEDRYDTSLAIAQYFVPSLSAYSSFGAGSPSRDQAVCIATGNNYPDALADSIYAAKHKAPIILVDYSLSEQVIHYLESGELSKAAIFGGESVVGNDIEQQLRKLAGQ